MSSHLRRKKPAGVRRQYDRKIALNQADVKRIGRLIPHDL